jgi:CheY-like chemotaxis protein
MLAAAQCPQLGDRSGMKTILLVDDDQPVRILYGLVLRRNGYHVLEADSGGAALDMARKHLPDLILSDIIIPGSDGVSLLRKIRDDPDLKYKPFVLMSGSPDLVTSYKGIEAADDFLVKPIGLQELLNCIKTRFLGDPASNRSTKREGTSNGSGGSVGLESF